MATTRPTRSLHLVDIDNLLGDPAMYDEIEIGWTICAYKHAASFVEGDHVRRHPLAPRPDADVPPRARPRVNAGGRTIGVGLRAARAPTRRREPIDLVERGRCIPAAGRA
jgi:hypothetical protein